MYFRSACLRLEALQDLVDPLHVLRLHEHAQQLADLLADVTLLDDDLGRLVRPIEDGLDGGDGIPVALAVAGPDLVVRRRRLLGRLEFLLEGVEVLLCLREVPLRVAELLLERLVAGVLLDVGDAVLGDVRDLVHALGALGLVADDVRRHAARQLRLEAEELVHRHLQAVGGLAGELGDTGVVGARDVADHRRGEHLGLLLLVDDDAADEAGDRALDVTDVLHLGEVANGRTDLSEGSARVLQVEVDGDRVSLDLDPLELTLDEFEFLRGGAVCGVEPEGTEEGAAHGSCLCFPPLQGHRGLYGIGWLIGVDRGIGNTWL